MMMSSGSNLPERIDEGASHELFPYGFWAKLSDRFHGWRDGTKHLPHPDGPEKRTAHHAKLDRTAHAMYGREFTRVKRQLRASLRKVNSSGHRLATMKRRLDDARAKLEDAERQRAVDQAAYDRLRLGPRRDEDQFTDCWQRMQNSNNAADAARNVVNNLEDEIDAINDSFTELLSSADEHAQSATQRAHLVRNHIGRRYDHYRRSLVDSHPRGQQLEAELAVLTPPPAPVFLVVASRGGTVQVNRFDNYS
jgi:chromosome segregation ATPase